jgi:hypothetical protein
MQQKFVRELFLVKKFSKIFCTFIELSFKLKLQIFILCMPDFS